MFNVATRTACISPELTRVLPVLLLLLKNFQKQNEKQFKIQTETNLDPFFKNMATFWTKINFRFSYAFSIFCKVFNSIEEVTLSI